MICEDEPLTRLGELMFDQNPECEFCGRSMVGRFGGIVSHQCDSCRDEFERLNDAGKVWLA